MTTPELQRQGELNPAHRVIGQVTARAYPGSYQTGRPRSRCGTDQHAVMLPSVAVAVRRGYLAVWAMRVLHGQGRQGHDRQAAFLLALWDDGLLPVSHLSLTERGTCSCSQMGSDTCAGHLSWPRLLGSRMTSRLPSACGPCRRN